MPLSEALLNQVRQIAAEVRSDEGAARLASDADEAARAERFRAALSAAVATLTGRCGPLGDAPVFISGMAGSDVLMGGAGSDILSGGLDTDTFFFRRGADKDVITDFDAKGADHDMIYLTSIKSMDSFADIKAHMSLQDGDTVIDFGKGDQLTISDVKPGELGAEHFNLNGFDL